MYENVYYGVKLGSSSSQVGETISSVDMYMKKAGSPSESGTIQVIRGTTVVGESDSIAMSTVDGSGDWVTFPFSTGVSLQANDYVIFKRDGSGNQNPNEYSRADLVELFEFG